MIVNKTRNENKWSFFSTVHNDFDAIQRYRNKDTRKKKHKHTQVGREGEKTI